MMSTSVSSVAARATDHDVAVIDCGLMGAALARTLVAGGFSVTAWNRTPERAQALVPDGITPARSAEAAVQSSRLVIVCTTSTESTLSALGAVDLDDVTLVNLTSGTPDEAEAMERWAAEQGAAYLDGAIFCYPHEIGAASTMIAYSGTPSVWAAHRRTLMFLVGASDHVSGQVRAANLLLLGNLPFFVGALEAYVEAATYLQREGLSAAEMRVTTLQCLDLLRHATEEVASAIESGNHATEQATITTFAEGARSALAAIRQAGVHALMLAVATENIEGAQAAGLGSLGFSAQTRLAMPDSPSCP
ncbi:MULTISPECIES: NAD(P)-dependent oxidoreductase [unclassified Rhodococcus (in: high G+C Gram-positive bacteria)]|uniref:NAD(P)-dependent oxidoreductase n=1 Tax=unclassified Rhodococcus (in: high G+C Gram-positive bacteria) TaxID=192944 RepID=UPI00163A5CF4|nr:MULTISPECIES: NAD(P)-binding domain-containing protein [unclassified Rhodococcus (in: high G+C Gram-positive bacteria)]MBC2641981.1 NAD(P)-dependent oxidoreductase [Rhodococcus sp. 3A]MBC2893278.1 NAD(P)-dependent oxidoreductase [Rhodococcus sp. 4CII]